MTVQIDMLLSWKAVGFIIGAVDMGPLIGGGLTSWYRFKLSMLP